MDILKVDKMKNRRYIIQIILLITVLILMGINIHTTNELKKGTKLNFYELGKAAGINATLTLVSRKLYTGKNYTVDEIYELTDSISEIEKKLNK